MRVFTVVLLAGLTFPAYSNELLPSRDLFVDRSSVAESSCVDFSGTWQGGCLRRTDDGEVTYAEVLHIEQDGCDEVKVNGSLTYHPGGQITITDAYPAGRISATIQVEWEGDVLVSRSNFVGRERGEENLDINFTGTGHSDTRLDEGRLKVVSKNSWVATLPSGQEFPGEELKVCEYDRQD